VITGCRRVGLLLLVALGASCSQRGESETFEAKAEWAAKAFPAPVIGQPELRESLDGVLLVDTRTPEEYAVSHLPGAVNWPDYKTAPLPQSVHAQLADGGPVVFYCSIGYRSGEATVRAEEVLGTGHALYNLRGGIFQWANEGGTLEGGERVHGYDEEWDQLLLPERRLPE
jgi:rhodanese-related sulfurtransferase